MECGPAASGFLCACFFRLCALASSGEIRSPCGSGSRRKEPPRTGVPGGVRAAVGRVVRVGVVAVVVMVGRRGLGGTKMLSWADPWLSGHDRRPRGPGGEDWR